MPVTSTENRVEYAGNGSTTVFDVNFYFLDEGDLKVYVRSSAGAETLQTLTTHYTTTGEGMQAGGTVTMVTAPASGEQLVIFRDPVITQETDYQENDAFPAETHERALDRLTMVAQRLSERADRSMRLPDAAEEASTELPAPALNADKFLKINAAGDGVEAVTFSALSDAITVTETALADNDILVNQSGVYRNKPMLQHVGDVTIASATTTDVLGAAGPNVIITGTTTITSLGTGANRIVFVRFSGALTLTHNATSLILPGGANITTVAGDTMIVVSDASSNARVLAYQAADGRMLTPLDTNGHQVRLSKGADIATATTVTLGADGNYFELTGTTTVTGFATVGIGTTVRLKAVGVFDLTNSANLVCPGGDDITTAAGDTFDIHEFDTAQWEISNYQRVALAPTPVLSEEYTSPHQTITAGGQISLAHGLSSTPKLVQGFLVNVTDQHGYVTGDILPIGVGFYATQGTNDYGVTVASTSSNLKIVYGSETGVFIIHVESTGDGLGLTLANWKFFVRAWA